MAAITIGTARDLSRDELTHLLNRAFSDYIVHLQISPDDLDSMVERDDILLDRSFVAYDEGRAVGVALVALRPGRDGVRTRLASMGVAPEGRRMGTGRALLRRVIAAAREHGARTLQLEVFAGNAPARLLYEAHGFLSRRRLLGFTLPAAPLHASTIDSVTLRPAQNGELLPLFAICVAAELPEAAPPWQLDAPALMRFGPPTALYRIETRHASGADPTSGTAGAHATPTASGTDPNSGTAQESAPPNSAITAGYLVLGQGRPAAGLVHLGILPSWRRRGIATAALAAALAQHPDIEELYVPQLVPEASPLVPFLQALGAARESEEQIEMELEL